MNFVLVITFLNLTPTYGLPYQEMQIVGSDYTRNECFMMGNLMKATIEGSERKKNFEFMCIGVEKPWLF